MMIKPRWQAVLFTLCACLAVSLFLVFRPPLEMQILLLAPLVAIFGLPHGALDLPIAEILWPLRGWRGKLWFMLIYLSLVASFVILWLLLPSLAFAAFLLYSLVHFSDDWIDAGPLLRWTGGFATIGAPALLHHAEVSALFSYLAPPVAAGLGADVAAFVGGGSLFVLVAIVVLFPRLRGQAATEQAVLWAAALILPPLIYFAVYFCALHSIRHFTTTIKKAPRARRALFLAGLLSAMVTLVGVGIVQLRLQIAPTSLLETSVQVIFIGLAALTVPHMILVERFHQIKMPDVTGVE